MQNIYKNVYYKLILEEALAQLSDNILPQPFNYLLTNLKQAMLKAIDAVETQFIEINTEVNIWKNKLIEAWKNFSNILTSEQKVSLNNILMDLTNKYRLYMHGCNTGY